MAILKGILNDSWDHYKRLDAKIKKLLKKLPAGTIFQRRIGNQTYHYLNVRKGSKVVSCYLGKERPKQLEDAIRERRLLLKQHKDVRQSLRVLAKTRPRAPRG
jgi:hypothetical protein